MKTVQFGKNEITLFDSMHSIPPHRESKMNYYYMAEMGIGHDFLGVEAHLSAIQLAVIEGEASVVNQAIENLKLCYMSAIAEYNPKYIAWICLIHSINGELLTDISEDNLRKVADKLSEEANGSMNWEEVFDEIKKKFSTTSETFSRSGEPLLPEIFS
jgi:hypothetical protein